MGDSERGSQQAKYERNEETKAMIKNRKAAYKSCRYKLLGLVNYRSQKKISPKLTKARFGIQDMGELLLDGVNDDYSHTELLQISNDTMMLLLNSGREGAVRGSTLNMGTSPCMIYYTAASR